MLRDKPNILVVDQGGFGWLGGRQYTINLVRALLAHRGDSGAYDISVLARGVDELRHYNPLAPRLFACTSLESDSTRVSFFTRLRWAFERRVFGRANPWTEDKFREVGATFVYPYASKSFPSAAWISDFQYDYFPDKMTENEVSARISEFTNAIQQSQRIVLSSYCAERDCHRLFPASRGRTEVLQFRAFADDAWLEIDPAEIVKKYNLPRRYALISNWMLPTKNHSLVLEALAALPIEERNRVHVVCTGELYDYRNPGFYNEFLSSIHMLGLSAQISVLGVISKSDQIQLLRAADFYLQPSLFEGWNTGIEEARMLGKKVVASDIPVHLEQDVPGASYFRARDHEDLAGKISLEFQNSDHTGFSPEAERDALSEYSKLQADVGKKFFSICVPKC